jgi:hypothetical protein
VGVLGKERPKDSRFSAAPSPSPAIECRGQKKFLKIQQKVTEMSRSCLVLSVAAINRSAIGLGVWEPKAVWKVGFGESVREESDRNERSSIDRARESS